MSDSLTETVRAAAKLPVGSHTTPAGQEANASVNRRRAVVLALVAATWAGLLGLSASVLVPLKSPILALVLVACVAVSTPWTILGFWNGVIGFWLLRGRWQARAEWFDVSCAQAMPIRTRIAVAMTLRNEDPARAVSRLAIVKDSLERTGEGSAFSYFVLSDTDRYDIAPAEEEAIARWRSSQGAPEKIVYRRRQQNAGFKAGNIRDFCERRGNDFDFLLTLDADSLMTGDAIVRLVRIMQARPEIGILQSLVVGTPANSPFQRLFQFGMRLGMRSYTAGQAWWTADCGPYWGHNALLRIKPFRDHCELPSVRGGPPFGGPVLSHDQIEAVLMRRAGYEVRVLPLEDGSYEDNPPDVLEFVRRDVRWCLGNLQYLRLLDLPGLKQVSRYQLIWAILMFLGLPAWTMLIALSPLAMMQAHDMASYPVGRAEALYVTILLMHLTPKLAGLLEAWLSQSEARRFGGRARLLTGAIFETGFSFLLGAVSTFRTTLFMLGLPFGLKVAWDGQRRDARGVSWRDAISAFWPQTLFGIAVCTSLAFVSPQALLWSLPLTVGYVLAIPFAVLSASTGVMRWLHTCGIAAIPEDFAPPREIAALKASAGD